MSSLLFVSDLKYSCGYGAHKVLGGCLGWGYYLSVTFPKLYHVFLTWRSCHWIHLEDENLCFLSIYFVVWITEGLRMFPLLFLSSLPPRRGDCDPWILHVFLLWNLILNLLFGIIHPLCLFCDYFNPLKVPFFRFDPPILHKIWQLCSY